MMSPPIENKLQLDYIPVHKTFVSPMNFDTVAVVFMFFYFSYSSLPTTNNIYYCLTETSIEKMYNKKKKKP